MSKAKNVFSIIGAVILSVIFVLTATVASVYYSVATIATPKSVSSVIRQVDYSTFTEGTEVDGEVLNEFVKTPEMKAFIDDFSEQMMNGIYGKDGLTADSLKALFDEHRDDILKAAGKLGDVKATPEEFSEAIEQIITENADAINESLAELQESSAPAATTIQIIGETLEAKTIIILALFFAVLLGLIYLLRRRNFGGFIWIAVCTGATGIHTLALFLAFKLVLPNLLELELGTGSFEENMASQILSVSDKGFIILIATALFIMAAAIAAAIVFKRTAKAKQPEN